MSRAWLILVLFSTLGCAEGGARSEDGGVDPVGLDDAGTDAAAPVECRVDRDCDDHLVCTGVERCIGGTCASGNGTTCDDEIACTKDECTEPSGECLHTPEDERCPDGQMCSATLGCVERIPCTTQADCDDGVFCNGEEICDPSEGCQSGETPSCEDGIACTMDSCDAASDACANPALDAMCSDGLACNGAESCVPLAPDANANGCVSGTPVTCDDGMSCTVDSCSEPSGTCVNSAPDADGDGYPAESCGGSDCDDDAMDVNPDATEICDGVDNNCDGITDEGCTATPSNDACAGAVALSGVGSRGDTLVGATKDADGCGSGVEVFYRVTVSASSMVYLDTLGSSFDTRISYLGTTCPGSVVECVDDSCSSYQSQLAVLVSAGMHYFAVHTYTSMTTPDAFDLSYAVVSAAGGDNTELSSIGDYAGSTSGSSAVTGTCGSLARSAEDAFWWTQCPGDSRTLVATTCAGATDYDTVLHLRRDGTELLCDDDFESSIFSCSTLGPSYLGTTTSGVGLYQIFVDGWSTSSTGAYTLQVEDF